MFLVETVGLLPGAGRLTDDEITDLIEVIVDRLDALAIDPSVGTIRRGGDIEISVSVTTQEKDEPDAMLSGLTAITTAFHAAGLGDGERVTLRDTKYVLSHLQPA